MPAGRPRATREHTDLNGLTKAEPDRYKSRARTSDLAVKQVSGIDCPKKYMSQTKKAWKAIVPGLLSLGVMAEIDLPSLGLMFDAYDDYVKYTIKEKELTKSIDWYNEKAVGLVARVNSMKRHSLEEFNKLASRFGITPVERTRLQFEKIDEKNDDPLSVVIGG